MHSLFSDCFAILFIPEISNLNNYNDEDLNGKPNYKIINDILNFVSDYYKEIENPENYDILNDTDCKQQLEDKIKKFI